MSALSLYTEVRLHQQPWQNPQRHVLQPPPIVLSTVRLRLRWWHRLRPDKAGRRAGGQTIEKIRTLKPNLYMVTGGGANTLIRVTPDGLIVVDTKNPGDENFNRLMEEIRSVSTLPVK